MSILSIEELKNLVDQTQGVCVSLYMPMVRLGSETQQNPIRFKNLIRQAEEQLANQGMRSTEAVELLQPAHDLDHEDFWQHQSDGLAIFIANGVFHYYCVPTSFDELVVVSDRFHIKPLLPLLTGDGKFYLLTLSQEDEVKFFEGSRFSIRELEVGNMPKTLNAALHYDGPDQGIEQRIATSRGGTNNSFQQPGSFHGQGNDGAKQNDILQFFHALDASLHETLRNQKAPLVLAGVEYLLPLYREANTYPHLLDEGITGNQKISQPEELHAATWQIVEPLFQQAQQQAVEHYRELNGTGKNSHDLKEAVSAAYYGRVEQLFVAVGVQQWGTFDPDANQIQVHTDAQPGDEDLLDSAAIQTLLNGGTVYAVEPDQVPEEAPLAAVFRY
ncbi:MAG: hypothetical protein KME12_21450 [Trichocoleus desertorum ATA4-8-CV12]|jgi:hypothetical protein|nr:hypothetical protein [Trichocoleus desertorum ATA4-8-CV12]